jgi:hypothetical protein
VDSSSILADRQLGQLTFTDDEDVIAYFTEGQCNALAYEIHLLTGWTLALISDLPARSEDYCGHVFIIDSDGLAVDIEGIENLATFREKDKWSWMPYIYRFFSLSEFQMEMGPWDNQIHYTRDKEAKKWARIIVDILDS